MRGTKDAGDQGERAAARYLETRSYAILSRQWRCRYGELDLVARDLNGTVCFVEVKLRGAGSIGLPREFVDSRKRERLRRAANLYMGLHSLDCPARFDVAEIYEESGGGLRVEYLESAFE